MRHDSLAAEMWRGFRDCEEVFTVIGSEHQFPEAAALASQMGEVAPALFDQVHRSIAIDTAGLPRPRCIPYVAGIRECGMLPDVPSNRDSGTECNQTYAMP